MPVLEKPNTEKGSEELLLDPKIIADLMEDLDRVFRIGVYYPSGHTMCDQAAQHFMKAFEKTLGKEPAIKFETAGGVLSLQGLTLEPDVRGVSDFRELLEALGIARVEMDSGLTDADLYDFVSGMLAYRNRLKGSKDFQRIQVEGMPPTITIHHIEFLASDAEELSDQCSGDTSQPRLETLMGALRQKGLDEAQVEQCRQLMRSIPRYLTSGDREKSGLPQVTWTDVEKLLLNAVQSKPEADKDGDSPSPHANLDALTSIFRSLGQNRETDEHGQAINMLLSLARRESSPDSQPESETKGKKATAVENLMPMVELRRAIDGCEGRMGADFQLMTEGRSEELTILCQMLQREQKLPVHNRIKKQLRDILRTPLEPQEWTVLVAGARQLLELPDSQQIVSPMVLMTEMIRSCKSISSMAFLGEVANGAEPQQMDLLWPFLVNEILLEGSGDQREDYEKVVSLASSVGSAARQEGFSTLENLPSVKKKICAPDLLSQPTAGIYEILASLLDWNPGLYLGRPVLAGLKMTPPNWVCAGVLPLIPEFHNEHQKFLVGLLDQADGSESTKDVLESASRILGQYLPHLPRNRRSEPWVPASIRTVVQLRMVGSQRFLESVMCSRRFLFIAKWPTDCRKAAAEIYATLPNPSGNPKKGRKGK